MYAFTKKLSTLAQCRWPPMLAFPSPLTTQCMCGLPSLISPVPESSNGCFSSLTMSFCASSLSMLLIPHPSMAPINDAIAPLRTPADLSWRAIDVITSSPGPTDMSNIVPLAVLSVGDGTIASQNCADRSQTFGSRFVAYRGVQRGRCGLGRFLLELVEEDNAAPSRGAVA